MFRSFKTLAEGFILKLNNLKRNEKLFQISKILFAINIPQFEFFEIQILSHFDFWSLNKSFLTRPTVFASSGLNRSSMRFANNQWSRKNLDNIMLRTNLSQSFPSDVGGSRDQLCHHGATEQNRVGEGFSGLGRPQIILSRKKSASIGPLCHYMYNSSTCGDLVGCHRSLTDEWTDNKACAPQFV